MWFIEQGNINQQNKKTKIKKKRMEKKVRTIFEQELKNINEQLEKGFAGLEPDLIIYGDGSWHLSLNDGQTTNGESIEQIYNMIDNLLYEEQ